MTTKKYKKEFYFNHSETETIVISWNTGLKNICIYYNEILIKELIEASILKKGIDIETSVIGSLYVKMNIRPLSFIVKSGDLYLKNSIIPEINKINVTTKIINFIGVVCLISGLGEFLLDFFSYYGIRSFFQLIKYWQFYFGLMLIVSTKFIKKGYLYLFAINILSIGSGILYLFSMMIEGNPFEFRDEEVVWRLVFYGIGLFFLFFLFYNIKPMLILKKNRVVWETLERTDDEILDDY